MKRKIRSCNNAFITQKTEVQLARPVLSDQVFVKAHIHVTYIIKAQNDICILSLSKANVHIFQENNLKGFEAQGRPLSLAHPNLLWWSLFD
jgi:hypothetical protein